MQNANAHPTTEQWADRILTDPERTNLREVQAATLEARNHGITLRKYEQLKALAAILALEPGRDVNRHLGPFEAADLTRLERAGIIEPEAGGDQDSRLGYWARADDLDPFDEADADPAGDWEWAAED